MEGCGNIQREGVERTITLDRELINVQAGGTSDFNELENRPSYNGEQMTGDTNIPAVPTAVSELTNDSNYQTGSQVESTVQQAVGAVSGDLSSEITAREQADRALNTAIGDETSARQLADTNLQGQIDAITASSDVKDVVGTKADLNNYDTSTLGNNDIIKVLQDESEGNATTYYRWSTTTEQFTLIGEEGPYYTKSQADTLLNAKQNTLTAGTGITITNDVISADGGGLTTLSYGHSNWQDFITAYNASKIVYCRASSNSDPGSGSQTRMAFMAYINNPTSPTEVEFQYVRSVSNKTATNQTDQVFVYKLTSANGGTWTVETRNMASKVAAGANATSSYANTTITINPRLYTTTGQNTDGGITQKLFTDTVGDIETDMAGKQNALTAGTGIDITNDVISATGGGGGFTEITINSRSDSFYIADLDAGAYRVKIGQVSDAGPQYNTSGNGIIVMAPNSGGVLFVENYTNNTKSYWFLYRAINGENIARGVAVKTYSGSTVTFIPAVVNNLTEDNANRALAAPQGGVLNRRIGDLTTLTTTAKTSAVAAINELAARIAALEGN